MKVLDFTKETDELENKLIKLGFHYQSTDKEERPPKPLKKKNVENKGRGTTATPWN